MLITDVGAGRAISGNGTSSPQTSGFFAAKSEPIAGSLGLELASLGINNLRIVTSSGERMLYSRDQSEIPSFLKAIMFNSSPDLVVQPRTREAVSAVLRFAASKKIAAIPRGSGSSPFGGSVPVAGGIVVDVSGMDKIVGIDRSKQSARVQAGVRWADLDHELGKLGLALNTSPSSKFSTVGGWLSTGGMGLNSLSRGHVKNSVLGLELVTADGSIREMSRLDPEFELVFGSEGQLGVITEVSLSVRLAPAKSRPHLVGFDNPRAALDFVSSLRESAVKPGHVVFESASKFSLINEMLDKPYFQVKDSVLVNIEEESEEKAFQTLLKSLGLREETEFLARYMWNERYFPMKVRKAGPGMLGAEVVVPLSIMPDAIEKTKVLCAKFQLDPLFEVHFLKDGSGLLLCYYLTDQSNLWAYTLDAVKSMIITSNLTRLGARPYSIGVWNFPFSNAQDKDKVTRLAEAKRLMDPGGVMNSGKYFSLSGRMGGLLGKLFAPAVMGQALNLMTVFSPITARLMGAFGSVRRTATEKAAPKTIQDLVKVADECAMCGACVSVCPAYLIVRDERATGRGKLLTVKALARGESISKEHAARTFLCMKCKACEQVCQSKLELVSAYEVLEKELEKTYGKDAQEIEKFTKFAESSPEYDALVDRGLVLGAPRHGMGGEPNV